MNPTLVLDDHALFAKYRFARLMQPVGGIMTGVTRLAAEHTAPDLEIATNRLENVTKVFPHVVPPTGKDASNEPLGGAGADVDPELAWIRTVVEGAERYANMVYTEDDFVVASANELGEEALDLDTMPRCSEREYSDPRCAFVRPDKNARMRWVRGYSLINRKEIYVPAVCVYLYLDLWPSEYIWPMISTGTAAHTSAVAALNSAICEVIERDAIAMTWLSRLPLPEIEIEEPLPPDLAIHYAYSKKSLVRHRFFNATTDVGIPTVYAIQLLEGHPNVAQYVNCATNFSAATACAKTIRESLPARSIFRYDYPRPENIEDYTSLYHGASYLGQPAHRSAFDFLLKSGTTCSLSEMEIDVPQDDAARLNYVLQRLRQIGTDVIAFDITTDELREVGLWAVHVFIPGLVPMSVIHRARFLGHPRLYEYRERAGYGPMSESEVNPLPQPFA